MALFGGIFGKSEEVPVPGIPADFAQVVARIQGREPANDERLKFAPGLTVESFLPVSTEILVKPPEPPPSSPGPVFDPSSLKVGQLIDGKGIYAGTWEPKDRSGRSLGKIFDLYAAPKDIEDNKGKKILLTFNKAVQHVAGLRNWHGHDGIKMETDEAIYNAIRAGRTADLEKWFIPTKDALIENLYKNKDTGAFKGTFTTASGSDFALWYWSSAELPENPANVYVVRFSDGDGGWVRKDNFSLSGRPVRAELRP